MPRLATYTEARPSWIQAMLSGVTLAHIFKHRATLFYEDGTEETRRGKAPEVTDSIFPLVSWVQDGRATT